MRGNVGMNLWASVPPCSRCWISLVCHAIVMPIGIVFCDKNTSREVYVRRPCSTLLPRTCKHALKSQNYTVDKLHMCIPIRDSNQFDFTTTCWSLYAKFANADCLYTLCWLHSHTHTHVTFIVDGLGLLATAAELTRARVVTRQYHQSHIS